MSASPAESKAVYIYHGDDAFAIKRAVDALVEKTGEMSVTRLDARQCGEDEIVSATNTISFFSPHNLVILSNPFAKASTDAARKRFQALLENLPDTTTLVMVIEDVIERGSWKAFPMLDGNWMRKWLKAAGSRAEYQLFKLPALKEMPAWIREEARRQGGQITPDAATSLASHIGNDPQQISLEIAKLLTYVDLKRPIEIDDVEHLTAQAGLADVFEMVDAMAGGNARQATFLLHRLLETQDYHALFGMVVRQFRLLLQARELLDEGQGGRIQSELRLHPFVAGKLTDQARRFQMAQLEDIYHRLVLMDAAVKTSQVTGDLALEMFLAETAR